MKRLLMAWILCLWSIPAVAVPATVQVISNRTGTASVFSVTFPASTVAGDFVIVSAYFYKSEAFKSITDSQGNAFTEVGGQLVTQGGSASRVYYAQSIKGGPETITVNLWSNSPYLGLYLAEYSGISATSPIDGQIGSAGAAGAVSSGNITTTVVGDVVYGFCTSDGLCSPGSGFVSRMSLDGNLVEDKVTGTAGPYAAIASSNSGWSMQMVVLKPSGSVGLSPVITSGLTAMATAGMAFSYQIAATNSPTSFTAAGLPSGLSVSASTGLISGTPTLAGASIITMTAKNSAGIGSAILALIVQNPSGVILEQVVDNGIQTIPGVTLQPGGCSVTAIPSANATTSMTASINTNTNLAGVAGYVPSQNGTPSFYPVWISPGQINVEFCNNTPNQIITGSFPVLWKLLLP